MIRWDCGSSSWAVLIKARILDIFLSDEGIKLEVPRDGLAAQSSVGPIGPTNSMEGLGALGPPNLVSQNGSGSSAAALAVDRVTTCEDSTLISRSAEGSSPLTAQ